MPLPTGKQLSHESRDWARRERERRLRQVRAQIRGGTYETARKLDIALDRLIEAEGFTSHAPVMRPDDAAMEDLCEREFQLQTGFQDTAIYRDACDIAGE